MQRCHPSYPHISTTEISVHKNAEFKIKYNYFEKLDSNY